MAQLLEARGHEHPHRIWHETYLVRAGKYEAVYGNLPPFGLGKAGRLVPVAEGKTARERFRAAASGIPGQAG